MPPRRLETPDALTEWGLSGMERDRDSRRVGRVAGRALAAVPLAFAAGTSWQLGFREPGTFTQLDFDVLHLAGQLALAGEPETAYRFADFAAAQARVSDGTTPMTWTYPPPFNLVVMALAPLPAWAAHGLFTLTTIAAWLWALWRVGGRDAPVALLGVLPAALACAIVGQNGFLTGSLAGWAVLLALAGRDGSAGVPLGLLVLKPHLGIGLGLWALLRRGGTMAAVALGVAAALCLAATAVQGPGVWGAFLGAVSEAKAFLAAGDYPLNRMVSVFAALRSFGLAPDLALAVHVAVGLGGLGALAGALARGWAPRRTAAVALIASLLASPYCYDYDLPMLGVALALVLRDLSRREEAAALALSAAAGGWGLASALFAGRVWPGVPGSGSEWISLGSPLLLALVALILRALARAEGRAPARAGRLQLAAEPG